MTRIEIISDGWRFAARLTFFISTVSINKIVPQSAKNKKPAMSVDHRGQN